MSLGCGTLASPSGFKTGTQAAASSNGRQHSLPASPSRTVFNSTDLESHWGPKQSKLPTRLWGSTTETKFGGVEVLDGQKEAWISGEFWNVDSNIRKWGLHEVKRNAASANHDVHRNDQVTRIVLPPHPDDPRQQRIPARRCVSGVASADDCFLEAWGFDLGLRDRQGNPTPLWRPTGPGGEHFRSERSYSRNLQRMTEQYRGMRRVSSTPGFAGKTGALSISTTLRPEDIGGDAGEHSVMEDKQLESAGRLHGSRSCRGWDDHLHCARREAAKMANSVHSPALATRHEDGIPVIEGRLAPAAIYTRRHKIQNGGATS